MPYKLPKDRGVNFSVLELKTIAAFNDEGDADLYLWNNLGKKTGFNFRRQLYRETTEQ